MSVALADVDVPVPARRLYRLLQRFCGANASGTWWGPQSTLTGMLGMPLRTLQRRLKLLVDAGLVQVRRWITDWGYKSMNIYTIPTLVRSSDPLGQSHDQNGASKVVALRGREENHLTVVQSPRDPHIWHESDVWFMSRPKKSAPTGQLAFDFGQDATDAADQLDSCNPACDTTYGSVSSKEGRGTPASRSVSYWLSGRTTRPPAGVIAGVAGAIKRCLTQRPDLSEQDVRDAIDSLMMSARDASPRAYLIEFGLQKRSRAPKVTTLWMHRPAVPTMTRERMQEIRQRRAARTPSPRVAPSQNVRLIPAAPVTLAASTVCDANQTTTTPNLTASVPSTPPWPNYSPESSNVGGPAAAKRGASFDGTEEEAVPGPVVDPGAASTVPRRPLWDLDPDGYPWWLDRSTWTWEKTKHLPSCPDKGEGYALITPPPEAGFSHSGRVKIAIRRPVRPRSDLGNAMTNLLASLGIAPPS